MPTFAKETTVSIESSKREIEITLKRYGADQFLYGWEERRALIGFRISDRQVQIELPLPDVLEFSLTRQHRARSDEAMQACWEQSCRQRWRALLLVIKAKLEAVECGISTVEREFLADVRLPSGSTVGEWLRPQIAASYKDGRMPALLPGRNGSLPALPPAVEERSR